jgi:nicotinamide mononucleotide transporter
MGIFRELIEQVWLSCVVKWLTQNYIEILATITGLIYLYYSIKGDKRLWVYGFISSMIYVYVCYVAGIYADMGINLYYVVVSIYGWIHWTLYSGQQKKEIPITRTKTKEYFLIVSFTAVLYLIIVLVLIYYTDSNIPYLDALTTSAGITATWMLARKMLEHWIIWVFVDALSVGLYIYKELYPTSILFLTYTFLAVTGFIQWRKQWLIQKIN